MYGYELIVFVDCEGRQSQPERLLALPYRYLAGCSTITAMLRQLREETAEGFIECHTPRTIRFNRTCECVVVGDRPATVYREESR